MGNTSTFITDHRQSGYYSSAWRTRVGHLGSARSAVPPSSAVLLQLNTRGRLDPNVCLHTRKHWAHGCQVNTTNCGARRPSDQCIGSFTRGLFQFAKLAFVYDQTASSHVHQPEQSPCWSNWYVSTHRHVGNKSVCVMTLEHIQSTPRCAPLCLVDQIVATIWNSLTRRCFPFRCHAQV